MDDAWVKVKCKAKSKVMMDFGGDVGGGEALRIYGKLFLSKFYFSWDKGKTNFSL